MTPKQRDALELGQKIRNIGCMDSLANRFFPPDLRQQVRVICDDAMHRLGYESLTEHDERRSQFWASDESIEAANTWSSHKFAQFFKYRKLDTNETRS